MTTDYELNFPAPSSFYEIPLDPERLEAVTREVTDLFSGAASEEERERFIRMCLGVVQQAREQNCVYLGVGMLRAEDEKIVQATMSVYVEEITPTSPKLATAAIANDLKSAGDDRDLSILELPAGPAVRDLHVLEYETVPPEHPTVAVQLQYWIPFPEGDRTVIVDFSTTDVDHWKELTEIMDGMMEHATFQLPEMEGSAEQRDMINSALNPDDN